jgi:hypothetical protein
MTVDICGDYSQGRTPFERPTCKWHNNIKMCLREIGCEDVNLIVSEQNSIGSFFDHRKTFLGCKKAENFFIG